MSLPCEPQEPLDLNSRFRCPHSPILLNAENSLRVPLKSDSEARQSLPCVRMFLVTCIIPGMETIPGGGAGGGGGDEGHDGSG